MKQRKNIIIILMIIGIVLIYSVISSIYKINELTKNYETAEGICIGETIYYRC